MDIKQYQQYVKEGMSPNYTLEVGLLGLVGETGEVCDVMKKKNIYPERNIDVNSKMLDEMGDVLWQYCAVLNLVGLDIEEVIKFNVDKLNARHGGAGKTDSTGGKR